MRQATDTLEVETRGLGLTDITRRIRAFTEASGITAGLLTVWCRHTSASLVVQENTDPDVRADLQDFLASLAPEAPGRYRHDAEGPDDMPAHMRAVLTQTQLSIPMHDGDLALGIWQAVYLWEHRRRPHRREIVLHVLGE